MTITISKEKRAKFWAQVKKEFPKNYTLQNVHYAQLVIGEKTKGMSSEEYIKFIKSEAKRASGNK